MVSDFNHIHDRNTFCDADDEINAGITCFLDSCSCPGRRNINHGNVCTGLFLASLTDPKIGRPSQTCPAFFGFTPPTKHSLTKSVISAKTSVELAGFTGHTLKMMREFLFTKMLMLFLRCQFYGFLRGVTERLG